MMAICSMMARSLGVLGAANRRWRIVAPGVASNSVVATKRTGPIAVGTVFRYVRSSYGRQSRTSSMIATDTGIARIFVFGGPGLIATFGHPTVHPGTDAPPTTHS
jgi:hypothetical protein